jgi:hypothetical protein
MRSTLINIVLLLGGFSQANCQWVVGIEGGVNKNYLVTTNSSQSFTQYDGYPGFSVGVPVIFQINSWFALESDPNFMQKNYRINRTGFFQGVYQINTNSYLQLPILANFNFGGQQIKGFVNFGLYIAYWVSSKIKGTEANILNTSDTTNLNPTNILNEDNSYYYKQKYQFGSKDNRLEFGYIGNVGISYDVNMAYSIFVEGIYCYSVTDQQKKYQINQIPRYNTTYGLQIGCLFKIGSN